MSTNTFNSIAEIIPRVRKSPTPPRVRLAQNLRRLIDMHAEGVYKVAKEADVEPATIYNLLKQSFDPRISTIEKVTKVFGLQVWQILATDLEAKPVDELEVLALLELYVEADEAGRKTIMQVAEIASRKTAETV